MDYTTYLLPGDTIKAKTQSYYFTKDKTYVISKSFMKNGNIIHFVTDDYGKDNLLHLFNFEITAKTDKAINARRLKARLDFLWKNRIERFVDSKNIFDRTKTFKLSFSYFVNDPSAIAAIMIENIVPPGAKGPEGLVSDRPRYFDVSNGYTYFYKEKDFYDYMKSYFKNTDTPDDIFYRLSLPCSHIDAMNAIDEDSYIRFAGLPYFESLKQVNSYSEELRTGTLYQHTNDSWYQYLNEIALFIFRKQKIETEVEKNILIDILDLFVILPSSYGATAISKILNGTGSIKNKNIDSYKGKYRGIYSSTQIFELADAISIYMHKNNVFNTKESYSSGDEWRGQFEFIGNASIDVKKVIEHKEIITKII